MLSDVAIKQQSDLLLSRACRYCWLSAERPLPSKLMQDLANAGVLVPVDVTTTGEFLDHFDSRGLHAPLTQEQRDDA